MIFKIKRGEKMETIHNLPPQPYKKFFGRQDSINKIWEILIKGGTFIASIDGVGGIGKTALGYYFCKEILLPSNEFDYLVWLTAKEEVFDSFSNNFMIKKVRGDFKGIEELIDTILSVAGLEEEIDKPFNIKKEFVEDQILKGAKIFIVLDNLESIEDDQFFDYITRDFNKFAAENRSLKVLTTSRKRKKIVDFPIEIGGLAVEDALKMLKYLASEYNIKDILNASDHDNIKLIEKVGCIPLGIEFIIGQMRLGKSRGQIYNELRGFPSLENVKSESEKRKRLSDIILFSFKNMYETLTEDQQYVFKVITAYVKNKSKNDPPLSFELLVTITGYKKQELESCIDTLKDNNLIVVTKNNEYSLTPMTINFVKQYYDDFAKIEDDIVAKKNKIIQNIIYKEIDKVSIFLNSIQELINDNKFEDAEAKLLNALEVMPDSRIYFELAKVQRILNKFSKAEDNFRDATVLNPKNVKIWYEWINMEDSRGRHNIALQLSEKALEETNNDVSLVIQRINILKYKRFFDQLRKEVKRYLEIYDKEQRQEEYLRLLRNWKNIEYNLIKESIIQPEYYFDAVELLIEKEVDIEVKIQLCREALKIANKTNKPDKVSSFYGKIKKFEDKAIKNIPSKTRNLNVLFNNKNYDEAKKEARKILNLIFEDEEYEEYSKNALRVLLHIFLIEKNYDKVILTFEEYKKLGYRDQNCLDIYEKAKKEKKLEEKRNIIKEIMHNIQECELEIRQLIMWSLDYEEEKLLELVKNKGKSEWIAQWELTKNKSLKKDELLIHYSDLAQIRSILAWIKSEIINKFEDSSKRNEIIKSIHKIMSYLENYISQERNESFHSRLQLYETEKLNDFLVDTRRTLEEIKKFKDLLGIR
jgi:tetratricopeptide (TPR) repeat protein